MVWELQAMGLLTNVPQAISIFSYCNEMARGLSCCCTEKKINTKYILEITRDKMQPISE